MAERDGLVVALTNLPAAELNAVYVEAAPSDPAGALAWAEEEFRRRGHPFFGVDLEPGRYQDVDRAMAAAGSLR